MPLYLRSLMVEAGLDPRTVKVLRHTHASRGGDLLGVWRRNRELFERYQAIQPQRQRSSFARPFWAAFIAEPSGAACFVGVYATELLGPAPSDYPEPLGRSPPSPIVHDLYGWTLTAHLKEFVGRLFIAEWEGRNWSRRGEGDHEVIELARTIPEPSFPGLLEFVRPLSELAYLPQAWLSHLRQGRGVYLLTCPRTKEQYVGKADGIDGFLGRWEEYASTGHGGNVRLRSRDPADYQVSVLEVAGSAATPHEIVQMEDRWKRKLQSREMGLNAN